MFSGKGHPGSSIRVQWRFEHASLLPPRFCCMGGGHPPLLEFNITDLTRLYGSMTLLVSICFLEILEFAVGIDLHTCFSQRFAAGGRPSWQHVGIILPRTSSFNPPDCRVQSSEWTMKQDRRSFSDDKRTGRLTGGSSWFLNPSGLTGQEALKSTP